MNEGLTLFGYFLIGGIVLLGLLAGLYSYAFLAYPEEKDFRGATAMRVLIILNSSTSVIFVFLVAVDIFCKGGE